MQPPVPQYALGTTAVAAGLLPFALAALVGLQPSPSASVAADPATHIIVLRTAVDVDAVAVEHGVRVAGRYRNVFPGFAGIVPDGRLNALERDPRVAWVEPNRTFQPLQQVLPAGVDRIDADLNASAQIDGVDQRVPVVVAVMDTGVQGTHPDLNVNVQKSVDCTTVATTCTPGVALDTDGHGTHLAGIVGALDNGFGVVGVAPGAEIWSIKVCAGTCYLDQVLKGHDYLSANAASVAVANISLGAWGWSDALRVGIANNVALGIVMVAAAGNDGADIYGGDGTIANGNEFIPAAFPEVAAVSALADSDGRAGGTGNITTAGPDDTLAATSNFSTSVVADHPVTSPGAAIDLAAPGVHILSTYKDGGYVFGTGTSFAAPHVAGAAALWIAARGTRDANGDGLVNGADVYTVRQALINGGQPQWQWGPADTRDPDGHREPLVRAANAAPPPPTATPTSAPPTATPSRTPSPTSSATGTPTGKPTATPLPSATRTPTALPTSASSATPAPTATALPIMGTIHVGDLAGTSTRTGNTWSATVWVLVHNNAHNPVGGAQVTGAWSEGYAGVGSCKTGPGGWCGFSTGSMSIKNRSVAFTVTLVSYSTWVYDPLANHDPGGDSSGTTVRVLRP